MARFVAALVTAQPDAKTEQGALFSKVAML